MKRKLLGVLLCVSMTAGMLAGCGSASESAQTAESAGKAEEKAGTTEKAEAAEASGEKTVISISCWDIQDQFNAENAANDTIFNEMVEELNIEITPVNITWNDWSEKNNVWAASGQLPDMFAAAVATDNPGLYRSWAQQGILKALPDDLSAYPNLEKIMQMDAVQPLKVDGKFYCIPRMTYADSESWVLDRVINYRKDWAAEAGWTKEPETFEEFVQMCKDVKEIKSNVTILTVNSNAYLMYLGTDILPQFCNETAWVYENDQWVPSWTSEKVPKIFERFRTLYREGILDPDFASAKDGDAQNMFYSGQSFALVCGAPSTGQLQTLKEADATVTDMNESIGIISSFTAEDGNNYYFTNYPYWSETLISSAVDDEKLAKCLELIDYMLSDEFKSRKNNGMEGNDWELQDGNRVLLLDSLTALEEKYPISQSGKFGCFASWDNDYAYTGNKVVDSNPEYAAFDATKAELYQSVKANDTAAPMNFDIALMTNDAKTNYFNNIKNCFLENMINIIIGDGTAQEGYEKMIGEMNALGLQKMVASVTEQAKTEGIEP